MDIAWEILKKLKTRDVSDKSEHTVCMIFFFYEKCISDKIDS